MYLLHHLMDRTKATISHKYELPNLRGDIRTHIKFCKNCKKTGNKT